MGPNIKNIVLSLIIQLILSMYFTTVNARADIIASTHYDKSTTCPTVSVEVKNRGTKTLHRIFLILRSGDITLETASRTNILPNQSSNIIFSSCIRESILQHPLLVQVTSYEDNFVPHFDLFSITDSTTHEPGAVMINADCSGYNCTLSLNNQLLQSVSGTLTAYYASTTKSQLSYPEALTIGAGEKKILHKKLVQSYITRNTTLPILWSYEYKTAGQITSHSISSVLYLPPIGDDWEIIQHQIILVTIILFTAFFLVWLFERKSSIEY